MTTMTTMTDQFAEKRCSGQSRLACALARLASAQKPGTGVPAYTRWVNRWLARGPAAAAYVLGLSPAQVTMISLGTSLLGMTVIVGLPTTVPHGILAAFLLATGFVLDSADGQLARLARASSPAGEWLDHVADAARTPLVHLSVLVGVARGTGLTWWLVIPLLFCVVEVTQSHSQMLAEQLRKARSGPTSRVAPLNSLQSWLLLPTDTGVLCWSFLLWGFPQLFAWWYAGLAGIALAHSAVSLRRRYRELREMTASTTQD